MFRGVVGHLTGSVPDPRSLCRAWVNFSGQGTPSLNGSGFNVASSITDNAVGDFTLTWSRAFRAASSYGVMKLARVDDVATGGTVVGHPTVAPTASSMRIRVYDNAGLLRDPPVCCLALWGW